jgi:hypothetical protein
MPEPDQPHGAIDDFPELDPPFRTITSVAMACRTSVTWSPRACGRPAQSTPRLTVFREQHQSSRTWKSS